jgi:hypothetical protein
LGAGRGDPQDGEQQHAYKSASRGAQTWRRLTGRACDPQNRLVTAELEARWNRALTHVGEIEGKIAAHDASTPEPSSLSSADLNAISANLQTVWAAPTTDARLKKRIVRTVIHEVVADIDD